MGGGALLIRGMWGLGDNLYQRPFVRAAASRFDVWLETPWPELYADLPVRFVRGDRALRTQRKNLARQPASLFADPPAGAREVRVAYGHAQLDRPNGSILRALDELLPLTGHPLRLDLPDMGPPPVTADKPIAVVRPVTVRTEWRNEARNPKPEYLAWVSEQLLETHHVVAVADLQGGAEEALNPLPRFHQGFLRGELDVRALLALCASADLLAGGVGWIVPAALAVQRPAFIVLGGQGGHNAPAKITDPRLDASRLGWAFPDRFCTCSNMLHPCAKTISNLPAQFSAWRRSAQATRAT